MYGHDLKCPTDLFAPQAVGYCDRCAQKRYLADLVWQRDYRGASLQNTRLRVCSDRCLDMPADQLRPIRIEGPEGVVRDPRPFVAGAGYAADGPHLPAAPNFPADGVITD